MGKVGSLSIAAAVCIIIAVLLQDYANEEGWAAVFACVGALFIGWGIVEMFRRVK